MLDNTSYIIFKKFKSSTEIMLSQKLNLIQSDNLQELVCTITSCEFKFLIQRIFSILLEKSQIVSAVYNISGKESNLRGRGRRAIQLKEQQLKMSTVFTGGRAGSSCRLVLRNVARCLGRWNGDTRVQPGPGVHPPPTRCTH